MKFHVMLVVAVATLFQSAHAQTANELRRNEAPAELRGHGGPVKAVAVSADGSTLISAGFDSALILWDTATGSAKRVLRFHGSTVNAVATLQGDCFASGGEDAKIAIWCGSDAVPQKRANMSERKLSLSVSFSLRIPLKAG